MCEEVCCLLQGIPPIDWKNWGKQAQNSAPQVRFVRSSSGNTSQKTTTERSKKHKDNIKMDFRDNGWKYERFMDLA